MHITSRQMWPLLLLVSLAAGCDDITTLPCNTSIKTCYIHPNVCNALDTIFYGYGSGWTFVFVLYIQASASNRCYEIEGGMSPYCTQPVLSASAANFSFNLSTSVGVFDNDVTFTVLPNHPLYAASIVLPTPLFAALPYVLRIRGTTFTSTNVAFVSTYAITTGILYTGGAGRLTVVNARFTNIYVSVVVQTPGVDIHLTACEAGMGVINGYPVLAVIMGALNTSRIVAATNQLVFVDYTTPFLNTTANVEIFNVSSILLYTLSMPAIAACPAVEIPSVSTSTLHTAMQAGIAAVAGVLIIMLVRRHYHTHTHGLR